MYALRLASLFSTAALLLSCASSVDATDDQDWADEGISPELARSFATAPPATAHILPLSHHPRFLRDGDPAAAAGTGVKLEWFGGPVIPNVKIVTVHWGSGVQFADTIDGFYRAITQSGYFDWLKEYDTSQQSIGRGSFVTRYVDASPPSGTTVTDDQIRAELLKLIGDKKVPASDQDTLYMFHFPPGITIQMGTDASCSTFCAYHNTAVDAAGKYVYYGVIPDMGGGCAWGCGPIFQNEKNTTSVASHELIEAVTDPAVGQAQDYAYPLAWYDKQGGQGEIGDICNAQQGVVAGYTVQLEWSNEKNACIAVKDGTTPADEFSLSLSPGSVTVMPGGTATITVSTAVVSGSPGNVALSASGLPAGASATFDKTSVAAGGSATLTIATTSAVAAGSTTFTITGKAAAATHAIPATLVVQAGTAPGIVNGGFEDGNRNGWQSDGPKVWATKLRAHTGAWSGKIGSALGYKGKNGLYQVFAVPASGKPALDFYYYVRCKGTTATDHAQALITDGQGNPLATVLDVCELDHAWKHATVDLSRYAGQNVAVYFQVIDDGDVATATYMYVDDVKLL